MAIENLTTSDESRLSGAYIRTLVKQLTSSPKSTNSITNENLLTNDNQSIICDTKGADFVMAKPKNQNNATTQGHKKQVRRRLHTSRPYQERLLNMAEARKEIVTALKFHRASMKQANEKKQQQQQQQKQHLEHQMRGQQQSTCEIRIPKIEPSSHFTSNTNVMVENLPYYPSSSYDNHNYCYYPSSNYWPIISSSSQINESDLNIPLPNQTLGLNLNLQAFANLDTTFYHSSSINTTSPANFKYSTSSSSSTPRDLYGASTSAEAVAGLGPTCMMSSTMDMMSSMHSALDEEEMAKMRSIGEQHQVEWDDTVDLVKSAWWLKVLKSVEFSNKEIKREEGYDGNFSSHEYNSDECSFEELGEFPAWLNGNNDDQNLLQQHMDESSSEGTALPWVDIGDIDGMDEEWLS